MFWIVTGPAATLIKNIVVDSDESAGSAFKKAWHTCRIADRERFTSLFTVSVSGGGASASRNNCSSVGSVGGASSPGGSASTRPA
ncbi:hypothetical protein ON010_g13352 [Phytophthora cinnamomi]|nr:hypothetical protein ON010_g13352 [Phytophthora cinnamomi]